MYNYCRFFLLVFHIFYNFGLGMVIASDHRVYIAMHCQIATMKPVPVSAPS